MQGKQQEVAQFFEKHDLEGDPAYRLIDLVSEIGEIASETAKTTSYGLEPEQLNISRDELGDAAFSLLALANSLEVELESCLEEAIEKYEGRIQSSGDPGSK